MNIDTAYVYDLMDELEDRRAANYPVLHGNVVAWVITGSMMYNLNTALSDIDLMIITDSQDDGKDFNDASYRDGLDVRVVSAYDFADRIMNDDSIYVDIRQSGSLRWLDTTLKPYIDAARYNPGRCVRNLEARTRANLRSAIERVETNPKRVRKDLRMALRNTLVQNRMRLPERFGEDVRFTDEQRDEYYAALVNMFMLLGARHREGAYPEDLLYLLTVRCEDLALSINPGAEIIGTRYV